MPDLLQKETLETKDKAQLVLVYFLEIELYVFTESSTYILSCSYFWMSGKSQPIVHCSIVTGNTELDPKQPPDLPEYSETFVPA